MSDGVQRRGRDLIEERLEQVVIAAIEQRDAHRRVGQRARAVEPAESAADDDDVGPIAVESHATFITRRGRV